MARRVLLTSGGRADIGERLLTAKLQILNGTGNRRPALALNVLTGRAEDSLAERYDALVATPATPSEVPSEDVQSSVATVAPVQRSRSHLHARTVYLTEAHLRDIETIIQAWQPGRTRRLTRSAVLRRAIEHLRGAVEADPATSLLESE